MIANSSVVVGLLAQQINALAPPDFDHPGKSQVVHRAVLALLAEFRVHQAQAAAGLPDETGFKHVEEGVRHRPLAVVMSLAAAGNDRHTLSAVLLYSIVMASVALSSSGTIGQEASIMSNTKIQVRLPEDMKEAAMRQASASGVSMNLFFATAVAARMGLQPRTTGYKPLRFSSDSRLEAMSLRFSSMLNSIFMTHSMR